MATGDSLIPDGIIDDFKMSEKFTSFSQQIRTTDSGDTWATDTDTTDSVNNKITMTNEPTGNIVILSYISQNEPYTQTDPMPVQLVQPKVIATNSHSVYRGAMLTKSVTGKVAVGNGVRGYESKVLENAEIGTYDYKNTGVSVSATMNTGETVYNLDGNDTNGLSGYVYEILAGGTIDLSTANYSNTGAFGLLGKYPIIGTTPENTPITLDEEDSAGCKVFKTLAVDPDNNEYCLQVVGEEMIWDFDLDYHTEFTDITVSTVVNTLTINNIYNITDGDYKGYWRCVANGSASAISDSKFTIGSGGDTIVSYGNVVFFEIWDGNGRGEDGTFSQQTNGTLTDLNGHPVRTYNGFKRTGHFKKDN